MKSLKKIAALVGLLSLCASAHASIFYVGYSTPAATVIPLATGAGTVSAVVISSGNAGDFCTWFDSANVNGITQGVESSTTGATNPITRLGDLFVSTNAASGYPATASTVGNQPPVTFTKGLMFICSVARHVRVWITQP